MNMTMSDREIVIMMHRCKIEIIALRKVNESLQPKADAYDNITTILRLFNMSRPGLPVSEDILWELQRRIDEFENIDRSRDMAQAQNKPKGAM